jgi:lysozyme family protein
MDRTRFNICLEQVLQHEGGYADHPSDPGGATNMGITRKTLARWRKVLPWWKLGKDAVRALERSEAARIYRASYWERSKAGSLPPGLDLVLFDFAVNSGPDRAIRALQAELGTVADGQIGPLTLDAVRVRIARDGAPALIGAYCARRLNFLSRLSSFSTFGKGWSRRVAAVRKSALASAGSTDQPDISNQWRTTMDLFNGYKTYIIASIMLLAGLAQILGLELPSLDGHSAGQMVMEALAVIFLRKGLKDDIARA